MSRLTKRCRQQASKAGTLRMAVRHRTASWMLPVLLMGGLIVCITSYVHLINDTSVKGYEISLMQEHTADLKNELDRLQSEIASLGSLSRIRSEGRLLSLSPAGTITYLNAHDSSIAMR